MIPLKPILSHIDNIPSTAGKFKPDKSSVYYIHHRLPKFTLWPIIFLSFILFFFFLSPTSTTSPRRRGLRTTSSYGGPAWENRVKLSAKPRSCTGHTVLVTGAVGFIGAHASVALKRRGDGVVGLDNFNRYYDITLKQSRKSKLVDRAGVFVVEGDINDEVLLRRLFGLVHFTHVLHLAAQAGVRYAMINPNSYIKSNIDGFVNLLEVVKSTIEQPAIVWASSSSVYGLNSKVPFSEKDRTDQPASLYAATKKAGEEIAHAYYHIYGLSITGLRFFTVYGPWGRPDMAYFFFTKDILNQKQISIFEGPNHGTIARDFTYIDDIVKGCLSAIDTANKSSKKKGEFRIINLGNTSPVSVHKLVSTLEKLLKMKAKKKVVLMPRNGDVPLTHANISLARMELGYKPTMDLEMGLKKFVKWYLDYYDAKKKSSW
ncbi:UDP-glucuronate 4-epimerase 5-like [Cynara cardunculus var. scolymus]|uniref:UDP-glucuronate 4-epimerase n=1 Tax=Cynara cardunculus var. scolymus TaxID=59895 RepID=A0A124SBA8_CYNCS|nr:UDP-glucuronate 4-epimerase 5-like [Cynara cardunculus var. scolymus]KVH90070.1 NAD-dependent epimerase/dehydratase [Cynara cardunculus var. scolymus]